MYDIDWMVELLCFFCLCTSVIMTMLHSDVISVAVGMDNQRSRLATFSGLPGTAQVSPSVASKAGFYYAGGDTVICYSCGVRVDLGDIGVDPMAIHRQRSPDCPFVSQQSPITEETDTNSIRSPYPESMSEVESQVTASVRATTVAATTAAHTGTTHAVSSRGRQTQSHRGGGDQRRRGRNRRRDYYEMLASYAAEANRHPAELRRHSRTTPSATEPNLNPEFNPELNPMLTYDTAPATIDDLLNILGLNISDMPEEESDSADHPRRLGQRINNNDPSLLDEMKYERRRLATYANWPADITVRPDALARDGLFYLCRADRVKCAFCYGIIRNWQPSENNPTAKHRRLFPRCPFLRDPRTAGNIAVGDEPTEGQRLNVTTSAAGVGDLGIQTSRPLNPAMAIESRRLTTFDTYPRDSLVSTDRLANAGFYYTGNADEVRCFFCDGRVSRWQYSDDPMNRHRQQFPDCGFVRLVAVVDEEETTSTQSHSEDVEMEDEGAPAGTASSLVCPVCNAADRSIVFLPCGHLACCTACASDRTTCPTCGGVVRGSVHAFLS